MRAVQERCGALGYSCGDGLYCTDNTTCQVALQTPSSPAPQPLCLHRASDHTCLHCASNSLPLLRLKPLPLLPLKPPLPPLRLKPFASVAPQPLASPRRVEPTSTTQTRPPPALMSLRPCLASACILASAPCVRDFCQCSRAMGRSLNVTCPGGLRFLSA